MNMNLSIVARKSPASNTNRPNEHSEHIKEEDKICHICLVLLERPHDQASGQMLKQTLESLISQGFEYWTPCLDYVKETLLVQQCDTTTEVQSLNILVRRLQEEESSLEAQTQSFKGFSTQTHQSLNSYDLQLKSLCDERKLLQKHLAKINK